MKEYIVTLRHMFNGNEKTVRVMADGEMGAEIVAEKEGGFNYVVIECTCVE